MALNIGSIKTFGHLNAVLQIKSAAAQTDRNITELLTYFVANMKVLTKDNKINKTINGWKQYGALKKKLTLTRLKAVERTSMR